MVLESTMLCFDNSDYQRNGDYFPTRLNAQKDGVNLVCLSKVRSNPENNVGLMTMSNTTEVLATLTSDVGRILSKLHLVNPNGDINLLTGLRIAHLVLKHRQGKNHKMRIVVFVGSPVAHDEADLVKLAKKLKKEKVNVDIVSFGDHQKNNDVFTAFISVLNGKDGTGSHLVCVPRGSVLSEALISSPIIQGEDGTGGAGLGGAGFEFGVDPNEDPELALALRVSMEEQRQRQEDETRRAQADSGAEAGVAVPAQEGSSSGSGAPVVQPNTEEALLERALALSSDDAMPDFANMTEEEQIAFAMQMSMQDAQQETPISQPAKRQKKDETPMEVDEDINEVITDPEFLQSVLENLPGVDPHSEAIRDAVGSLNKDKKDKEGDDKK
ncbi:26S proteasome non-ATPase regulatory subunit 4 [Culex quinquefasciatus]|uniref:26S proteasome non-ATPase regulatory subunit 4 n=1 Tax=Culex quinquefasciatus TaxID=7176 RepID=B0WC52_CULQU|nr:26S proteasome non-ATPase regulatory subunit 4 [Culex pipiens pallens]EDS43204.1 26S proteasome non-ATPase regulatory subunit 4 [Culex quinquefasciatus]|eukprot:XP_001846286.1 26S proteasome non-ATPase regulatory subunit 4 [Culex quinquefasciatus]